MNFIEPFNIEASTQLSFFIYKLTSLYTTSSFNINLNSTPLNLTLEPIVYAAATKLSSSFLEINLKDFEQEQQNEDEELPQLDSENSISIRSYETFDDLRSPTLLSRDMQLSHPRRPKSGEMVFDFEMEKIFFFFFFFS